MFTRATPLLHVTDKISGETFLVDTGAEVSIITPRPGDKEAAVAWGPRSRPQTVLALRPTGDGHAE